MTPYLEGPTMTPFMEALAMTILRLMLVMIPFMVMLAQTILMLEKARIESFIANLPQQYMLI